MDARDRLRRYVEQRRELGETEFVLDGMPVEDVLRLLGAAGASRATASSASPRVAEPTHRARANTNPTATEKRTESANERVKEGVKESATESVNIDATEHEVTGSTSATVPTVDQPPVPDVRFDAGASTDWRKTLAGQNPDAAAASASAPVKPAASESLSPTTSTAPASASDASRAANTPPSWLVALGIPMGLTAVGTRDTRPTGSLAAAATLDDVAAAIAACQACTLFRSATHPVPGEGNPNADFVCVGEAPGQSEDESGRPFVGAAGQLLTKILAAIQFPREEVFICNVLKHRPPGNRNPLPEEVHACNPYLTRQLELLRPRVILALGTFAAQTLLETSLSIGKLRGQVHRYQGVPLIVTYHPAALLRNEAWKRPTWEDVKLARRILDASRAANPSA